jgi:hypothetical protein
MTNLIKSVIACANPAADGKVSYHPIFRPAWEAENGTRKSPKTIIPSRVGQSWMAVWKIAVCN